MVRACLVVLLCALVSPVAAQSTERSRRAAVVDLIERRVRAQQELDIVADSTVLVGKVLHLKGHVRIVCSADIFVVAEAATIDVAAAKVELIGNLLISRGSNAARIERW